MAEESQNGNQLAGMVVEISGIWRWVGDEATPSSCPPFVCGLNRLSQIFLLFVV